MTAHGFRRTPFASRLLRHAMRDRARRETGSPASSTSPMFDDWREGIHGWVRQRTADLVGCRSHIDSSRGTFTGKRHDVVGDGYILMISLGEQRPRLIESRALQ